MYEDYLQHHGIKGMRWGHRKQRYTTGYGVRRRMRSDVNQPKTPEEAKRTRRRQIAKRVAIGAAAAAAIGATAYAVHRYKSNNSSAGSGTRTIDKINSFIGQKRRSSFQKQRDGINSFVDKQKSKNNSTQQKHSENNKKALNRVINRMGRDRRIEKHLKAAEHYAKSGKPEWEHMKFLNENKDMYTPDLLDKIAKAGLKGDHKKEAELINIGKKSFTSEQRQQIRDYGASLNKYTSSSKSNPSKSSKSTIATAKTVGKTVSTAAKGTAKVGSTVAKGTVKAGSAVAKGSSKVFNAAAQKKVADIAKRTPLNTDTSGLDDFTRELLKKNAKRLAKAGY